MGDNCVERNQLVALFLVGGCGASAVIGCIVLAALGHDLPPALTALAGTSMGSLGTWLMRPSPPASPAPAAAPPPVRRRAPHPPHTPPDEAAGGPS